MFQPLKEKFTALAEFAGQTCETDYEMLWQGEAEKQPAKAS